MNIVQNEQTKSKIIKVKWEDLLPFFPTTNPNILENLQITKECLFSTTTNVHSLYIRDLINLFYTKEESLNLTITDATACAGGTFMGLVNQVKKINAVELNTDHVTLMKHNFKIIFPNLHKKINFVNANYLTVWDRLGHQNVILIDPPWGGMDYKKQKQMKLYLKDKDGIKVELMDIIKMIMKNTEILIIRVPYNYEKWRFHKLKCCMFIEQVRFMKQCSSGKKRISYYMYVLAQNNPLKPISSLDLNQYCNTKSYREIEYTIL
jgi:16S rRNA G966 N2-methylase RsmD